MDGRWCVVEGVECGDPEGGLALLAGQERWWGCFQPHLTLHPDH